MPPLLSFKRTFNASIEIGDLVVSIHVARLDKAQLEEIDEGWDRWVQVPRGSVLPPVATASPQERIDFIHAERDRMKAWSDSVDKERFAFFESVLTRYVTIDEGLIEDSGVAVTDGQGFLRIFHGRRDVLRDLVGAVRDQNHLTDVMRKNLNSLRASEAGSAASDPARSGEKQGLTVANAAPSSSAAVAGATASPGGSVTAVAGASGEETKVH